MDDDYLRKVFHKYYQKGESDLKKDRILSRDYAWKASKEIVQKWLNMDGD